MLHSSTFDTNALTGAKTSSRNQKIVFVNRFFHPDISATSQILSDLAFALAAKGLDIHVIASQRNYQGSGSDLPAEETIDGVQIHRVWTTNFGRSSLIGRSADYLTFFVFAFFAMLRQLRAGDTLVVKTDPPLLSVVAMIATKIRSTRQINWLQDLFPEIAMASGFKSVRGPVRKVMQYLRDMSLRHAYANVVIGNLMKANLVARGIPEEKIQIQQNWAIGGSTPVMHEDNPLRKEWGLEGSFVVGYSGNLGFAHDYDIFLEAAELLRERSDIKFLFIGSGKHTRTLARQVSERNLTNFVFKPYQPASQLKYSLSAIDLHIVTLKHEFEGLIVPSKFYGIAAVARPTVFVGSPDGEIAALIKAYTGTSAAVNTAQEFANCVLALSDDPESAKALGQAMLERYGNRSRFNSVADSWVSMLEKPNATLETSLSHDYQSEKS